MKNKQKQLQLRDVNDVIYIIGGRWKSAILASLCDKEKRFNELQRDLQHITARTLIRELKFLEQNLLITKKECDNTSYYMLSEHGKSLESLIESIVAWGQKHRKIIIEQKDDTLIFADSEF
ncbi:DNA-binding transcriptional regulator, HxlR family [Chryseobacterium taichungense]|uniref:DNA-binding transcriptional regulator, HxlR family n=2 Tax=Chryseobacterium taichungense TaxID=295069 RepID=A0A1H7VN98_9FLAO|nr:DNA-binding transcriptional regulator, HxlR family [Chryseobacterium taichungense]